MFGKHFSRQLCGFILMSFNYHSRLAYGSLNWPRGRWLHREKGFWEEKNKHQHQYIAWNLASVKPQKNANLSPKLNNGPNHLMVVVKLVSSESWFWGHVLITILPVEVIQTLWRNVFNRCTILSSDSSSWLIHPVSQSESREIIKTNSKPWKPRASPIFHHFEFTAHLHLPFTKKKLFAK